MPKSQRSNKETIFI